MAKTKGEKPMSRLFWLVLVVVLLAVVLFVLFWNHRLYEWFVRHGVSNAAAAFLVYGPYCATALWLVYKLLAAHRRAPKQ